MLRTHGILVRVFLALLGAVLPIPLFGGDLEFSAPDPLFADTTPGVVGIVTVIHVEHFLLCIPDGHFPMREIECQMKEVLSGGNSWPAGETRRVSQLDYSGYTQAKTPESSVQTVAPSPLLGRDYLLLASHSEEGPSDPMDPEWIADSTRFLAAGWGLLLE